MRSLSCRPLDDQEVLPVIFPRLSKKLIAVSSPIRIRNRPLQSKLPFIRVPKNADFKVCAGEWETLEA